MKSWGEKMVSLMMDKAGQRIDSMISEFLAYKTGRGYSEHTATAYRGDLIDFRDFISTDGSPSDCEPSMDEITRHDVRRYVTYLHERQLSGSSIRRKVAALRSFFKYLWDIEVVHGNPTEGVALPKVEQKLPTFLSVSEVEALINAPDEKKLVGLRDKAILELLYSTGMRVGELLALDLTDLDKQMATVKVTGKGKKERLLPVGKSAMSVLKRYLDRRRELMSDHDTQALFLSMKGNRIPGSKSIARRIRKYAAKAKLNKNVTPHTLRHTFATHMLDGGTGIRYVQEFLGHVTLATTQIYTHVTVGRLKKVYELAHPRA